MLGAALAAGAVSLVIAACQGPVRPAAPGPPRAPAPGSLSISPADGSRGIKTGAPVTVTPVRARVTSITVTSGGAPVEGTVSEGGTVWRSRWALHASSTYRVTATGRSTSRKTVSGTGTVTRPSTSGRATTGRRTPR
jgi:Big-like domain-containing protein